MKRTFQVAAVVTCCLVLGGCSRRDSGAPEAAQRDSAPSPTGKITFASPNEAADAFSRAVAESDRAKLLAVFGADASGLLDSGDAVADRNAFERFSSELAKKRHVEEQPDGRYVLLVGEADWPFPIPIVRDAQRWSFDSKAGRKEILNRRIGENELKTIRLCRAFVEAEHEYRRKDRDRDGVLEYAQKAFSSPGKKDGLYWSSTEGDESPLGPLAAAAEREGYRRKGSDPTPFHGYYFKILTSQGSDADGGRKSYFDKRGNMTKGVALLAYPARWGASGIMTFIVAENGVVYERDLGMQTLAEAENVKEFNPGPGWEPVADPGEDAVEE